MVHPDSIENIQKQFPVLKHCLYANTATSGLLFEDLMEWRQGHDIDFLIGGSEMKLASHKLISETRKTITDFFNAEKHEISLVPNFTIGINFLMEGLPDNANVLLLEKDYPSVNWPVEERDFNLYYAKIDDHLEENIHTIVKENHIDIFVFSIVQWVDGILMDLEFIKNLKKEFPNLLIIADGTQFCGMYKFNFQESGIDVLGASGYKWLLGGYGNGFFMVKKSVQEQISLKCIGSGSVGGDPSKRNDIHFYKYLEPGHLDSLNFGSLKFSLEFLTRMGMDNVEEQNKTLSQKAKEAFMQLNLLDDKIAYRKNHSTIFNIKGNTQLFEKLSQKNVVCAQRGDGIRLSFHFYNDVAELDEIIKFVKK